MRAPSMAAYFVAQVGKGVRFPVGLCAERRSHGGFQIGGPEPGGSQLRAQRGYLGEQPGGIG
jgi:hypothetical protein